MGRAHDRSLALRNVGLEDSGVDELPYYDICIASAVEDVGDRGRGYGDVKQGSTADVARGSNEEQIQEAEKRTYDEESYARMSIRMSETVCSPSETSEGSSDPQSLERAITA